MSRDNTCPSDWHYPGRRCLGQCEVHLPFEIRRQDAAVTVKAMKGRAQRDEASSAAQCVETRVALAEPRV
eukprot:106670-Rhodomonas_salina.1